MIKFFFPKKSNKMFKFGLIFSLCFVAISASGEFTVLSNPKSISFKGDDVLDSHYVGDVLSAALGHAVSTDADWGGLIINDPFDLAKGVVAVLVDGVDHVSVGSNAKSYDLQGNHGADSINELAAQLESDSVAVCDIDFNNMDKAVTDFNNCFGDVAVSQIEETKNLKASTNIADKQLLQSIAYINAAADNLSNMLKSSNFLAIHVPLKNVIQIHGAKSDASNEALKLISSAVTNLNTAARKSSQNNALVVLVSQSSFSVRAKREAESEDFNLAKFYSEDYPVIFNIILWFMVVFGLSLLAICYAIGSMDPGRDSIIYRMTSTRMKKDN